MICCTRCRLKVTTGGVGITERPCAKSTFKFLRWTEIVEKVAHPEWFFYKFFRPPISQLDCKDYIIRCMQDCWHESPEMRPDFKSIRGRLKEMEAGL